MLLVQLDLILVFGNISLFHFLDRGQALFRELTNCWHQSPAAAAAEGFLGAEYRGLARMCTWMLVSWSKRQAAYPLFWQVRFFFLNSPQTHHPEKPLFPTTGSPREHIR